MDTMFSRIVTVFSVIGALVCLNILSVQNFVRLDLTRDSKFTLAEASEKTMRDLEDPVMITAYFSEELPPPFAGNAQFVRDLLEEYRAASGGMVSYAFIDPETQETAEDKETKKDVQQDIFGRRLREQTSIEKELEQLGISPVEIRVIEDDERKTKRGYMGIVVQYQEETETIPVVQETGGLEYNLTTMIRNLTRTRTPVLGIAQGHGEAALQGTQQGEPGELEQIKMLLEQLYEVRALNLPADLEDGKISADFDAMIVVGPTQAFDEASQKAIDAFLQTGKSAAFFLDNVSVDLRTFQVQPVDTGLNAQLSTYGIDIGPQLVADAEASQLMVTRQMGNMRVQQPLPYPFVPALRTLGAESPVTRGISDITLPFVAPVFLSEDVKKEGGDVVGKVLARTSERSWLEEPTPENLSPQRFTGRVSAEFTGPYDVLVTVEGKLKSHFTEGTTGEKPARVMVLGTSGLVREQFLSQPNAALALNAVDWLMLDPSVLNMRTRGLLDAPIDPDLTDGAKMTVKYGSVIAPPLLLALLGIVLMVMRNGRRSRLEAQAAKEKS